jgi:asparagine synthase (glutamine-hydrolysing)
MCGFVSIYSADSCLFRPSVLHAMTDSLRHRGPDDVGYAILGSSAHVSWKEAQPDALETAGVAFGHRRLSILDLSDAGRQPFQSADGQLWMVYNGEIYNYVELRRELRGLGHSFHTDTDTEVLLTAYRQWGQACLQRLNGMYAFLIWDGLSRTLFAARDRLGIKPLYYSCVNGIWLFASEVRALYRYPGFMPEPDSRQVFSFLWNDEVPEGGTTFYSNVKALPAAHYMRLGPGGVEARRYWNLPVEPAVRPESLSGRADELLALITDAVRLQLRADVPVATMLSGGLDSTTIAAVSNRLLRDHDPEAVSLGTRQRAISSLYPGSWNDESAKITELAQRLGIEVATVLPHEADMSDTFMDVVRAVEEPFGGTMPVVQFLMMRRAREIGVAVTLNGHGPDEIFAGYPHRHCSFVAAAYALAGQPRQAFAEWSAMKQLHQIGMTDLAYTFMRIMMPSTAHLARDLEMRRRRRYFGQEHFRNGVRSTRFADSENEGRTPLDRRLRRELFAEIVPRYLTYEDRVSMASSIESRVPFLDHRIVEFGFSLPDSDKIFNGTTKLILRRAVRDILPTSIHTSNLKVYIDPPFGRWLRGDLQSLVQDMFFGSEMKVAPYFDVPQLRRLMQRYMRAEKVGVWEQRLVWRAVVTEAWLRVVQDQR